MDTLGTYPHDSRAVFTYEIVGAVDAATIEDEKSPHCGFVWHQPTPHPHVWRIHRGRARIGQHAAIGNGKHDFGQSVFARDP